MKYIIDIPSEFLLKDDGYSFSDGNSYCITGNLSKLTPYTEPDRKVIEDEVWEFAREMISTSGHEVSEMWGCVTNFGEVMHNTTYQEAKAKYEAWLKQKNEIHVGDEVENASHKKGVVLNHYISPSNGLEYVRVLYMGDGNPFISAWEKNDVCKTGRHFDDVEELLKKIGSEE